MSTPDEEYYSKPTMNREYDEWLGYRKAWEQPPGPSQQIKMSPVLQGLVIAFPVVATLFVDWTFVWTFIPAVIILFVANF